MNSNLPPGVLLSDIDGPPMPKCVRCQEEVNHVNAIGLCEDCEEEDTNEKPFAVTERTMRDIFISPHEKKFPIT